MRSSHVWLLTIFITVAVAASLRLPRLTLRPMHTDEAVHADKLGEIFERKYYQYDPNEYHGPTLNGFTIPIAWLRGQTSYQELDETTLRLVPALFGIGLVVLTLLFYDGLGRKATAWAMLFVAISPAFCFYSRYYIQEVLLVFFTTAFLGCAWRYLQRPRIFWVVLAGLAAALMHATKETCVINFGCIGFAFIILVFQERPQRLRHIKCWHCIMGGAIALLVSALWFSWFWARPQGILDSYATYGIYLSRGAGHDTGHIHPWYYYLDLLTWIEGLEWPGWNEDYLVIGAVIGLLIAFWKRELAEGHLLFIRFMALYTFLMAIIYSGLSYKTPWCLLGFLHGMILLAAFATDHILKTTSSVWEKRVLYGFICLFAVGSPIVQSVLQNFQYEADQTNPYVYGHTHRDIYEIRDTIRQYLSVARQEPVIVQVVCPNADYWPLPWYLRDYPYLGWDDQVDVNRPASDIVITQPVMEGEVMHWLYDHAKPGERELYLYLWPERKQLRHHVELVGYVRKSLADSVRQ